MIRPAAAATQVGLLYTLIPKVPDVGYFRPIASDARDPRIQLVREVFGIKDAPESMYGVTIDEAVDFVSRDREDKLLEQIVDKFLLYRKIRPFVLVGGLDVRTVPKDWPPSMDTKVPLHPCSMRRPLCIQLQTLHMLDFAKVGQTLCNKAHFDAGGARTSRRILSKRKHT